MLPKINPRHKIRKALFGLTTVEEDESSLVITEGEYDAMAVY